MAQPLNLKELLALFEANADAERAKRMGAYLKGQFAFFGLPAPKRRSLQKPFLKKAQWFKGAELERIVGALWEVEHREVQYTALDLLIKCKKEANRERVSLYERLIVEKPWWDTVDLLASHLLGDLLWRFPDLAEEDPEVWINTQHIWLQRTALLYQLKYKERTDFKRLARYIKACADSEEFFIQKAIGWALREYGKHAPDTVKTFIESTELPKLSMREGSKYLY